MIKNDKIENLKEIEYYSNYNLIGEHILKLKKQNPKDKVYKEMSDCWTEIAFYVNELIRNQRLYNQSLSEYRADKTRAITRARLCEEKYEKSEILLEKYKKVYG
tara:strand:- start:1206 stop:1517 length:312 start_codon:yes stop_codon:yes gene_type:complete